MTPTSKNMRMDKLDDIVNKYNNTYHSTAKIKKKLLWSRKLKILFRGQMLLLTLNMKKLLERFKKKNCKKQIKMNLR